MKFSEAMLAWEQGKKVRCIAWAPGHFMCKNYDNTSAKDRMDFWFTIHEKWELYCEPEKLLSFAEVVKGLRSGKRFKRIVWASEIFVDAQSIHLRVKLRNDSYQTLKLEDYEANDWIEVI